MMTVKKMMYGTKVMETVCGMTGMDPAAVIGRKRTGGLTDARRMFCYYMCTQTDMKFTLSEIGAFIKRDHALVLYMKSTSENYIDTDFEYKAMMGKIKDHLDRNKILYGFKGKTILDDMPYEYNYHPQL